MSFPGGLKNGATVESRCCVCVGLGLSSKENCTQFLIKLDRDTVRVAGQARKHASLFFIGLASGHIFLDMHLTASVASYRVTIKERYKVLLYCEPNLRSGDLLRILGAYQIWSI